MIASFVGTKEGVGEAARYSEANYLDSFETKPHISFPANPNRRSRPSSTGAYSKEPNRKETQFTASPSIRPVHRG